jgi:sugar-specific transcriptional regulator TrmB
MKSLKSLVRMQKMTLDEKRRELVRLQEEAEQLRGALEKLEQEILAEQETARNDFEASFAYANYHKRAMQHRSRLQQAIRAADHSVEIASDAMREAFQELKRYEIAEAERVAAELAERKRKDGILLDETASIRFFRRKGQEEEPTE